MLTRPDTRPQSGWFHSPKVVLPFGAKPLGQADQVGNAEPRCTAGSFRTDGLGTRYPPADALDRSARGERSRAGSMRCLRRADAGEADADRVRPRRREHGPDPG